MDEFQNITEVWLPIVGHERFYQVSSLGRIRSLHTTQIRCQSIDRYGYPRIILYDNGKKTYRTTHQLVCEAFHGPRPAGNQVNHIDGIKTNNCPENLEWVTVRRNFIHAREHGLTPKIEEFFPALKGEASPCAKLTNSDVFAIRQCFAKKGYAILLAKRFGVSRTTIFRIRRRELWAHLD